MNWKILVKQSIITGVCAMATAKVAEWVLDLIREKVDEKRIDEIDERLDMLWEELDKIDDKIEAIG